MSVTLYRPVGEKELILIANSGFSVFPPRLDWQPIFYPVLNEQYAIDIASEWNVNDINGNYLGFVTKFNVADDEFNKYSTENVGGIHHNELWVPSEKLGQFNDSIIGKIEVIKVYVGEKFEQASDATITRIINQLK